MTYKPHILVVDDSETNRDLLSRILENYRVSTVASVQGARTQLALDPPDVMLLDVMLPDVDGLTFLSELRESHPYIPVIIITAYGSMERAIAALREGACDFLPAPYRPRSVLESVARVLRSCPQQAQAGSDSADGWSDKDYSNDNDHSHNGGNGHGNAFPEARLLVSPPPASDASPEQACMERGLQIAGQVAEGLMYEINSPLSVIRVNADLLEMTEDLSPRSRRRLRAIREAVGRIHRATTVLQTFSLSEGEPQEIYLNELLETLIGGLRQAGCLSNLRIETALPSDLPPIEAPPDLVWQMLRNIMLSIETACLGTEEEDCLIHIGADVREEMLYLDLKIKGHPPVSEGELKSLLQVPPLAGQSGDRARSLGLSTLAVRRALETLGGEIRMQHDGSDLTFILLLPLSQRQSIASGIR